MQWWIDTVGDLGPFFISIGSLLVAIAVWRGGYRTATATLELNRRAAAVEDQKLRLQLLQQRVSIIERLREMQAELWTSGTVGDETLHKLRRALLDASLVYDDSERLALEEMEKEVWGWYMLEAKLEHVGVGSERSELVEESGKLFASVTNGMGPLLDKLVEATRIRTII